MNGFIRVRRDRAIQLFSQLTSGPCQIVIVLILLLKVRSLPFTSSLISPLTPNIFVTAPNAMGDHELAAGAWGPVRSAWTAHRYSLVDGANSSLGCDNYAAVPLTLCSLLLRSPEDSLPQMQVHTSRSAVTATQSRLLSHPSARMSLPHRCRSLRLPQRRRPSFAPRNLFSSPSSRAVDIRLFPKRRAGHFHAVDGDLWIVPCL